MLEIKDFYELLALPTIYRLEKDPVLISDNKPGLFDRKAAWLSHNECCQLSLFFFPSQAESGKNVMEVCLKTQLKTN